MLGGAATVAGEEGVDPEKLRRAMAEGRVVIPRNVAGRARPLGIGEGLRVKVNANVGSSKDIAALRSPSRPIGWSSSP